jgi:hypothetical protein
MNKREKLWKETGIQGMRIERLLGDPKLIQHPLEFVGDTRRFDI